MTPLEIDVYPRKQTSKGINKRLRKKGLIPAVCYGKKKPNTLLAVNLKDIQKVFSTPYKENTLISLRSTEKENPFQALVMIKEYQIHPVKREIIHVDFIYTDLKKDVEIKVPLILEGRAKGVQMGAQLKQEFRYLPLKCKPELIPESIKINVQDMMPGTNLRVKEVKLNQGIKIRLDPMTILVAVSPLVEQKQEEKEESVPSSSS